MPNNVLPRLPMSKRLRAALEAGFPSGWHVGLGAIPRIPKAEGSDETVPVQPPYLIVWPLWGTEIQAEERWGSHRHADVDWTFQVDCVGLRVDQLEWMRDRVNATVLGLNADGAYVVDLDVPGTTEEPAIIVMERTLKDDAGMPEPGGSTLASSIRYGLLCTPGDTTP